MPQAVLDLIEMGRASCNEHIEKAFGDSKNHRSRMDG